MQLRADQLEQHLSRGIGPLYVIHGDEPLLALEAADAIRAKARAEGCSERDVFAVERGFDWSELTHAAAGMSLFADRKLIELRIPTGKPGPDGGAVIERYCERVVTENVTLVTVPRLAKREQQGGWFAALGRAGHIIEVYAVERARLPQWIAGRLARNKQRASDAALQFLADSVEGNLLAAHQEVQKLALLHPAGEIDFDQRRAAVLDVSRHDVSQLGEAMLAGDRRRAMKVLDSLRAEGEAPPRLVWVLAEELRTLARVQQAAQGGRASNDALRENRVWGEPRTGLMTRAVRRITRTDLEAAILHAGRCERMSKGVPRTSEVGDVWTELLGLTVRFAG